MTSVEEPPIEEPPRPQSDGTNLLQRAWRRINPKKYLNSYAIKALEAADIVLGSIQNPVAQIAAEIKDVALLAIKD